jgi:hypothetical protein
MRPLDELARFWNDMRSRMPQSAWSWPLVAAAAGALFVLIGVGSSERPAEANANVAAAPVGCQDQTWPFLSDDCLRRNAAEGAKADQKASNVRVIQPEAGMAAAAIGATQWAPKATPSSRQLPSRQKQATHDPDRSRAVTVRSGRRSRDAARERVYTVPEGAYRAYGYAPR